MSDIFNKPSSADPIGCSDWLTEIQTDGDARRLFEQFRWPDGPECPFCDSDAGFYSIRSTGKTATVRPGLLKCSACRRQFTVTVGTPLERSRIPLLGWVTALQLACESRMGVAPSRLAETLEVTVTSARRMLLRVRRAQQSRPLAASWVAALSIVARQRHAGSPTERLSADAAAAHLATFAFIRAERQENGISRTLLSAASVTLWPLSPKEALQDLIRVKRNDW